jgi:hypothetical protein
VQPGCAIEFLPILLATFATRPTAVLKSRNVSEREPEKEVAAEIVIYCKSICAGPRLSATLPVCGSRSLLDIWSIGPRKGMPCSAA